MNVEGAVALVTGANRGLGEAFTRLLLENGAAKVYGAARDPVAITVPGVVPVALDITSAADVDAAAAMADDVTLAEVLADDTSRFVRAQLSGALEVLYPSFVSS